MPESAATKASVYGATLLSSLLYCTHCGKRLVGGYNTKQLKSGAYHRPIYRCYNGAVKAKQCDGQSVYSAAKIEEAVFEVVRQYFSGFQESVDSVWQEQMRKHLRNKHNAAIRSAQASLEKLQRRQDMLRGEVLKSLEGESSFEPDLLKELLSENKVEIAAAEKTIARCTEEKQMEDARLAYLSEQYKHISDWAAEFDQCTNDEKKMILARIIERITVDKDYHITITFFVSYEDFMKGAEYSNEDIRIEESNHIYRTLAS